MTIQDYLESVSDKKVYVFGIGVSNIPLIKMLRDHNIAVTACDKNTREGLGATADELEALGVKLHLGATYMDNIDADLIFRSPGIRPDVPAFMAAAEKGAEITSEMEVFFNVCPCKKIAVTGSDGKTTTTTIIAKLLQQEGYRVHLGGNIGHPLLAETFDMRPEDIAVLELSSFQLMRMTSSPEIAVVTNVAPNHLDVHKGMEEYVASKKNIFLHQRATDRVILNRDNELTFSFVADAPGAVTLFSRENPMDTGIVIEQGVICVKKDGVSRPVLPVEGILLPGVHNIENYMAAIGAVDGLVKDETIRNFAKSFGGVEHRIELVRELHGVKYYNDSIGTSPSRTIAGLRSFKQKVILIAGGYDKHIPYDALGPEIVAHVKAMVLTGATAPKIREATEQADGFDSARLPIYDVDDFEEAVKKASALAQPGDVVILSPASAAFDKFKNFMVRGAFFKKIVNELQ